METKRMGERIREMRTQKEWSQAELARQVKVSRATVNQWESGTIKDIKLQTFLRLVEVLGCTPNHLIFGPSGTINAPQPGRKRSPVAGNRS
jgi:transcriptional regulator with XRE-family HTH domain